MKSADRLRAYHARLAALRWPDDLYQADRQFWPRNKRPAKAAKLFAAHLDRCQGRSSPKACDTALAEAVKR